MKQTYLKFSMLLLSLVIGLSAWADEVTYKTALFGKGYNSKGVSSYIDSWSATNGNFTVNIANFNNNNNQWDYIKAGSKNNASTASITTASAIDKAISSVAIIIDKVTADNITSITLYSGTSSDDISTNEGTFTVSADTQKVTISEPSANLYYKIEFVCTKGSSNGLIQISEVKYNIEVGDTYVAAPVIAYSNKVSDNTFYPYTTITLTSATSDATIKYSIESEAEDGAASIASDIAYTEPFTFADKTCTITAYAEKNGNKSESTSIKLTKATIDYSSIAQINAAVTETSTSVNVYATNWICTGVRSSNAYFTDSEGKEGIVVYQSNHGFKKGDVINGAFSCNIVLYNECSEITGLTATTSGVTVTKNGSETLNTASLADLTKNMQGTVMMLENMTYTGDKLQDAEGNTITPYGNFITLPAFIEGATYTIEGVIIWYKNKSIFEIAPRSIDDIAMDDFDYTRNTPAGNYGTICLPTYALCEGATVYTASLNESNDEVLLEEVDELTAGKSYIYQATADTQTFTCSGDAVSAPVVSTPLTGIFKAAAVPVGSYVLQTKEDAQKFYVVAENAQPTLSAYKAYLTVPADEASESKPRDIIISEEATPLAISAIEALTSGTAKIYDINGRQLKQIQKGVNIVNGVKVLVK